MTVSSSDADDVLYKTIELELRGAEPAVLQSYSWFTLHAAKHLQIPIGNWYVKFSCMLSDTLSDFILNNYNVYSWVPNKPRHDRLTLLKSIHIYKKHRVQYEVRTYFRHMTFHRLTGSTADTFLEYIQRNIPEGVAMKVTRVSEQCYTNKTLFSFGHLF